MPMNTFLHAEHTKIGNNFQKTGHSKHSYTFGCGFIANVQSSERQQQQQKWPIILQFSYNRLPCQIPMRWVYLECSGSKLCMMEHKRLQRILRMHTTSLWCQHIRVLGGTWWQHVFNEKLGAWCDSACH